MEHPTPTGHLTVSIIKSGIRFIVNGNSGIVKHLENLLAGRGIT